MAADDFPQLPFGTEDFAPKGGGLDFLGLRVVNLRILARDLLPGINNATSDVGSFMLGTWLPWKFQELCDKTSFTVENFDGFNEAVQIAIAYCQRKDAPAEEKYGAARTRIGVDQKLVFPTEFRFGKVGRTSATSIFAAPLYGPSLRSLGLHRGFAAGELGRVTNINLADDSADAVAIANYVDQKLRESNAYGKLIRLNPGGPTAAQLDDIGLRGLHPAIYRGMSVKLKQIFSRRLLPAPAEGKWNGRTLSAALLVATLRQKPGLDREQLLRVWHTGLIGSKSLKLIDPVLVQHRELWSLFIARQYQRFCLEYFMHCFERCLDSEMRTLPSCAANLVSEMPDTNATFREVCAAEAATIGLNGDMRTLSEGWNAQVHGRSANYDWGDDLDDDRPAESAMRMLARWHLRTFVRIAAWHGLEQLDWDGPDRVSVRWFSRWLEERADLPLARFVEDLLTQFVFAQHLRVAMGRFDGRDVQRLRFCLDDSGIVRTAAVEHDEPLEPSLMADRVGAFIALLTDLGIIHQTDSGMTVGKHEDLVPELR